MADRDKLKINVNCIDLPENSTPNGECHASGDEDKLSDVPKGILEFESDSKSKKGLQICQNKSPSSIEEEEDPEEVRPELAPIGSVLELVYRHTNQIKAFVEQDYNNNGDNYNGVNTHNDIGNLLKSSNTADERIRNSSSPENFDNIDKTAVREKYEDCNVKNPIPPAEKIKECFALGRNNGGLDEPLTLGIKEFTAKESVQVGKEKMDETQILEEHKLVSNIIQDHKESANKTMQNCAQLEGININEEIENANQMSISGNSKHDSFNATPNGTDINVSDLATSAKEDNVLRNGILNAEDRGEILENKTDFETQKKSDSIINIATDIEICEKEVEEFPHTFPHTKNQIEGKTWLEKSKIEPSLKEVFDSISMNLKSIIPLSSLKDDEALINADDSSQEISSNCIEKHSSATGEPIAQLQETAEKLLKEIQIFNMTNRSAVETIPTILAPTVETKNELSSTNVIQMFERENKIPVSDSTKKKTPYPKEPIDKFPTNTKRSKKSRKYIRPVEELEEDTICGLGSFRPQWIQKWATARSYLILYSIAGVLQGSYYTYLIGTLSTLEKRYAFESKIGGTIMMVDEITPLLLGVLVGYFGGRTHRPRMVAMGMFLSALCCFLSALPYFIYGSATHLVSYTVHNGTRPEYCDTQIKHEECIEDDRPPTMSAVVCLLVGSFLKGFGNLAYFAIGVAYMDDNAKKKNTPIYLAVSMSLRLLGPTVGFIMSSAFLRYYENPMMDPGFGPEDPRWIGAWWVGFVLQGILLLIFSFPILLFPRRLPSQRQRAFSNTENYDKESVTQRIGGLFKALKRLMKNPLYLWFCLGTIMSINGAFGHYIMLPKYMESQFRLSASDASLYSGPPGLIAIQIASILGGLAIWKFQPHTKKLIIGIGITETIGVLGYLILMIPSCQNLMMSGTTINTDGLLDLQNDCNSGCMCTERVFNPVCGPDGQSTYFSPCHAGCSDAIQSSTEVEKFVNCSCVHNSTGYFTTADSVTKGYCPVEGCWSQAIAYISALPIFQGITSIFRVAHTLILLRSVEPEDKSIALGTFEALLCLFAFIPYPVVYGALVDSACLIWETSCGQTGNCWFYDVDKFNYLLHGLSATFSGGSVICDIAIFYLCYRVKDLYNEDEPGKEPKKESRTPVQDEPSVTTCSVSLGGQDEMSKL